MLTVAVPVVASSSTARRALMWLVGALVLLVASMLVVAIAWQGSLLLSASTQTAADLPLEHWLRMQQAAAASGCGLEWPILAGIGKVESDFGRNPAMFEPHHGGIVGIVQIWRRARGRVRVGRVRTAS
jgi:hypothetical protein